MLVISRVLVLGLLVNGCVGGYYPLKEMTADQIKAATAAKEAAATCITATYAGAKATTIMVNVDRGVPSGIAIDENCKITFDSKPVAPPR
jgi:hypothetical protein